GEIGNERAMVALVELGPIGIAQTVESGKRLVGLAGSLVHPGAGQRRGEIGDRTLARLEEVFVGLVVAALLEGLAAEQETREPVGRVGLDQFLGKLDRIVPMGGGRFEQEGLLQDHLVLGILGERLGIELGGDFEVMVAAGHAAGKIIAKQRAGVFGTV